MTAYKAVGIIEGFETPESYEELLEAAQYLADTGLAWTLQGSIGRAVEAILSQDDDEE